MEISRGRGHGWSRGQCEKNQTAPDGPWFFVSGVATLLYVPRAAKDLVCVLEGID